jgi:dienelactone hydrolase
MTGVTDIEGFSRRTETFDGVSHEVYRAGTGPAVLVIHEIPGLHPGVIHFARRVVDAGFTAVLPSLFGTPGRPASRGYMAGVLLRVCVAREFAVFASGRSAPVVDWLRALAARAHEECGGPGVGAAGMCLTGGYALGMAVDDRMLAPVLSQPAQPAASTAARRASIDISPADLAKVRARGEDGLCVLGLRFTRDRAVPEERFGMLRRELGDAFIAVEIDSSPGNPYGIKPSAHSVLAADLVDEEGHPTHDALERVLAFFQERLTPQA